MKYCLKCGSELSDYTSFCGTCGTAVPKEAPAEPTMPVEPVAPVYDYAAPIYGYSDAPAPKKSKKGLLFGLIGGGVGTIALVLILCPILCLVFCGGSVEFGTSFNDAHDAMLSNDFILCNCDTDSMNGNNVIVATYKGEIDTLGNCEIQLIFNDKTDDAMFECSIMTPTKVEYETIDAFCQEKLDISCQEYKKGSSDYQDVYYLGEKDDLVVLIQLNEYDDPELNNYYISFINKSFIPQDQIAVLNEMLEYIKSNNN